MLYVILCVTLICINYSILIVVIVVILIKYHNNSTICQQSEIVSLTLSIYKRIFGNYIKHIFIGNINYFI